MELINLNERRQLRLLLNWTIYDYLQKKAKPQFSAIFRGFLKGRAGYVSSNFHQRSKPVPVAAGGDDFKYFLTASVRPRTCNFS